MRSTVDRIVRWVRANVAVTLAGVTLAILTIARVNFSNFEAFGVYLPNEFNDVPNVSIGNLQTVRSDEWGVATSRTLAQYYNQFLSSSSQYGPRPINVTWSALPTLDPSILIKPWSWGFMLFGLDHGFAWSWSSQLVASVLFSYLLLKKLLGGKIWLSAAGAFILALSPGILWWQMSGTLAAFCAILYALCALTERDTWVWRIGMSLVLLVATGTFLLSFYPPYVVPMFYLGVIVVVAYYADLRRDERPSFRALWTVKTLVPVALSAVALALIGVYIYLVARGDWQLIMNTAYPGQRRSAGGSLTGTYLYNYLTTLQLPFVPITYGGNESEMSSLITLFPVPLLLFFAKWRQVSSHLVRGVGAYALLLLVYCYVGFPDVVSSATLFSMSTNTRAFLVLGISLTVLLLVVVARTPVVPIKELTKRRHLVGLGVTLLLTAAFFLAGPKLAPEVLAYLGKRVYLVGAAITFGVAILGYIGRKGAAFSVLLATTLVTAIPISPINIGIDDLTQTPLATSVRTINAEQPGIWVTVDDLWLSKYVLAQGVPTYNAINYPPQLELFQKLDPTGANKDAYNRYAHIGIRLLDVPEPQFLLTAPDVLVMTLSPDDLATWGVSYVVTQGSMMPATPHTTFILLKSLPDNVQIYRLIRR